MALNGDAFLIMWHDIVPESRRDYVEWHTREHMPERLSIPGFLTGKRLINNDNEQYQYGTIYTGNDLEVFRSPAYLGRLNEPTDWSTRLQPCFRNFLRVACAKVATAGEGDGGAVATIRLDFTDGARPDDLRTSAPNLARAILGLSGVCAVHVGLARGEVSGVRTRETDLRPDMDQQSFDAVIVVEGSGYPELVEGLGDIEEAIEASGCPVTHPQSLVYNLAYQLTSADMHVANSI